MSFNFSPNPQANKNIQVASVMYFIQENSSNLASILENEAQAGDKTKIHRL